MIFRFLIVDDDRHYGRLLSYRLEKDSQHEIEILHDGKELLARLKEGAQPDLIMMDIMMPGMNGIETRVQRRS